MIDGRRRNGVEVDGHRAVVQPLEVHHRVGVASLAVDEHERLVRREAAKLDRAHRVRGAARGGAGHVDRRRQDLQRGTEFAGDERGLGLLGREHVDRDGRVERRARAEARRQDRDRIEFRARDSLCTRRSAGGAREDRRDGRA